MANTERLVRAYLAALDLTAICILGTSDDPPVMIRAGADVGPLVKRASAATSSAIEVKATRWCAHDRHAKLIVKTCNEDLPQLAGGWLAIAAPVAIKAVEIVAAGYGIALETDASIRERAEATVRAVEVELDRMKRAGDLRPVTRAYRAYRLARAAEGRGSPSWSSWLATYKADLIREAAQVRGPCSGSLTVGEGTRQSLAR